MLCTSAVHKLHTSREPSVTINHKFLIGEGYLSCQDERVTRYYIESEVYGLYGIREICGMNADSGIEVTTRVSKKRINREEIEYS